MLLCVPSFAGAVTGKEVVWSLETVSVFGVFWDAAASSSHVCGSALSLWPFPRNLSALPTALFAFALVFVGYCCSVASFPPRPSPCGALPVLSVCCRVFCPLPGSSAGQFVLGALVVIREISVLRHGYVNVGMHEWLESSIVFHLPSCSHGSIRSLHVSSCRWVWSGC